MKILKKELNIKKYKKIKRKNKIEKRNSTTILFLKNKLILW